MNPQDLGSATESGTPTPPTLRPPEVPEHLPTISEHSGHRPRVAGAGKLGVISAFALLHSVEQRLRTEYHDDVADELSKAIDVIAYELVRLKNPAGPAA